MKLDELPQPETRDTVAPENLEVDGDNPNEQSDEMFGLLCENIQQRGWIGNDIIADTNGTIADGEHRWLAAKEIGLNEVPVRFYDISDAERRLWRQELNKISGEHEDQQDAYEYDRILNNGLSDPLENLATATDDNIEDLINEVTNPTEADDIMADTSTSNSASTDDPSTPTPEPPDNPKSPPETQTGETDPRQEWDKNGTTEYQNEQKLPRYAEVTVKFHDEDAMNEFASLIDQSITKKTNTVHYPESEKWATTKNKISADGVDLHEQ
jgi:hypothetical protein